MTDEDLERANAALEQIRQDLMAFVAERYDPSLNDVDGEYEDRFWSEAMDHVIGPAEMWDRWTADVEADADHLRDLSEGRFLDFEDKVCWAWAAIVHMAMTEATRIEQEQRLFGQDTEPARVFSPAHTAIWALLERGRGIEGSGIHFVVSSYFYNVRGGVLDTTYAFHSLEDEE